MNPGYTALPSRSMISSDSYFDKMVLSFPTATNRLSLIAKAFAMEKPSSTVYIMALWTIRSTFSFWVHETKKMMQERSEKKIIFFIFGSLVNVSNWKADIFAE